MNESRIVTAVPEMLEPESYLLGHTDHELVRLARQAAVFAAPTEEVLRAAGLGPGMRVLDVGCGVGDVSLIAADLVGPTGEVLGVDRSSSAIAIARARTSALGLDRVRYAEGDLNSLSDQRFDAVIGRFILMHLPDPAQTLNAMAQRVAPNGVLAFVEMDISSTRAEPRLPLMDRCLGWIVEVYSKAGLEPDMGSKLYATFRAAGLTPQLKGSQRVEGGVDSAAYEHIVDSLRSLLPAMEKVGVATAAEVDLMTLAARLREEAARHEVCFVFPRLIGAWARV